jgi:hypothetical protein
MLEQVDNLTCPLRQQACENVLQIGNGSWPLICSSATGR